MSSKKAIMITVMIALVAIGLGFYSGMQYQMSKRRSFNGQPPNMNFPNGGNRMMGAMRPIEGEVTALDGQTITLKTKDGSNQLVIYSASTSINKNAPGSIDDLKIGENVSVIGTTDSGNTLTAKTIILGQRPTP